MRLLVWLLLGMTGVSTAHADNWPQWRGPLGTGVSRDARVPIAWNKQHHVRWKAALPGSGASTPVIWNDAVFVTSQDPRNRLLLSRLDKASGRIIWTREVGSAEVVRETPQRSRQKFHQLHNLASPSPVTDGQRVVAHFGNGDLACYDLDGNRIWQRNLQRDHGPYTVWWGHANSPVLYDGAVISVCMQDSLDDLREDPATSYLVAHDLRDGHVRWTTSRMTGAKAEACDSYTTPLLVTRDSGPQLVIMGGNLLDAYDPVSGRQLWRLAGLFGGRTITGPTAAEGLIFATRGMRGEMVAVRADGVGDLSRRNVQWSHKPGTPDTCCPVVWRDLLFMVSDDGIARCLEVANGRVRWTKRLQGDFKASPLAIDGRILLINTEGAATVISATGRFNRLTENRLEAEVLASPAVSDGSLYIRGSDTLFRIGTP